MYTTVDASHDSVAILVQSYLILKSFRTHGTFYKPKRDRDKNKTETRARVTTREKILTHTTPLARYTTHASTSWYLPTQR